MQYHTLAQVPEGTEVCIRDLQTDIAIRRRLLDLGLIPGTRVQCLQKSPFGDPTAFLIRGTVIALRGQDCNSIAVQ